MCIDYSDGEAKKTQFAVRFKTEEEFNKFKEVWEEAKESNNKLMA